MWLLFRKLTFFCQQLIDMIFTFTDSVKPKKNGFFLVFMIAFASFSKNDTTAYNPFFRDSILKNKIDTVRWHHLQNVLDIHKPASKIIALQQPKTAHKSIVFLMIAGVIILFILLLRLIFDDFAASLLEGILSMKKYYIFYKSKKYDSLFAVLSVYILKIAIFSYILYIGILFFGKDKFLVFSYDGFFRILALLTLFFTLKNITEFIFNSVIGTNDMFKAFFLQNLFAEFLLTIILLVVFMIYIYSSHVSSGFMLGFMIACLAGYAVFNIVRSYQLMSNIRIPHKLHFFLYICAFKIIPLLLLTKYILNNNID
jgi:hypothetical protein